MWVHFICSGNTNRSRLAEAYFNSKRISGITTTSSGIYADNNSNGDICEYSLKILEENHILQYTAKSWTKTSREVL
jgi:protein-tyrosine-phosphatase